jgi:aryl-alcohol dehydrogenase-like predicted oxidoreductase
MRFRALGRVAGQVSEVGYGMYGAGASEWSGTDLDEVRRSLQLAVDLDCTFFDTAAAYGDGASERLLGELLRANPDRNLIAATKVPPRNRQWPSRRGVPVAEVFPPDHIREYAERSLTNLGVNQLDLLQFHVWEDDWAADETWQRAVDDLRSDGLVAGIGVSLNRWEPWNGVKTVESGLIDTVQVIYNIFDQSPEDELFPACRRMRVGVIARVPFDEGGLTGTLTRDSTWPDRDWRNIYFGPENLGPTVSRAERLKALVPAGMTMPDLALDFILTNPDVSVVIPGMRRRSHVVANLSRGDEPPLSKDLVRELRSHRWDREPTAWSL